MLETFQNGTPTRDTYEQLAESETFQEIVARLNSIEFRMSSDDLEYLQKEAANKPSGYADQGYRHG